MKKLYQNILFIIKAFVNVTDEERNYCKFSKGYKNYKKCK